MRLHHAALPPTQPSPDSSAPDPDLPFPRRMVALCGVALGVAVFAVFAPFFTTGRVPFGGDLLMLNFPLLSMLHQTFAAGTLPLWNPFSGGGYPLAPFSALVAYPPTWLLAFLSPNQAIGWTYIADLLLAGAFMILLTRRLGATPPGSLVGALCFTFSGYVFAHIYAGHFLEMGVIAWMPAIFYFAHGALATPPPQTPRPMKPPHRWAQCLLAGICLGLQVLANGVEFLPFTVYPLLFVVACQGLTFVRRSRTVPSWHLVRRGVAGLLVVAAIAGGLSAVLTLPFLQVLAHSLRYAGVPYSDAAHLSLPLYALGMLAMPGLFGSAIDESYWLGPGQHLYFHELYAFPGVVALVAAVFAWLGRRRPPTVPLYSIIALGGLLLALGNNTPLYPPIFAVLPGMGLIRVPARWLLVVTFAVAILASRGVDVLVSCDVPRRRLTVVLFLVIGGLFALCVGPLFIAAHLSLPPSSLPLFTSRSWSTVAPAIVRLGVSLAVLSLLVLSRARGLLSPTACGLLLVAFTALDLASANLPLFRFVDLASYFTQSEVTAFIQAHPDNYRVLSLDHSLPLRAGMIDGAIQDIQDFAPMTLRDYWVYTHPIEAQDLASVDLAQARDTITAYDATVTRLLGVRYVFTDRPLSSPNLRPAGSFSAAHWAVPHDTSWNAVPWRVQTYVYRDAEALPPAFFASRQRTASTDQQAALLTRRGDVDLLRMAVLDPSPGASWWAHLAPWLGDVQAWWARWIAAHDRLWSTTSGGGWQIAAGQNVVAVQGRAAASGYLILDDLYYPGWVATVDGQPATILKVDALLSAVHLPPGNHHVQFVYAPLSFLCGLTITLLTIVALVLISLIWLVRRAFGPMPGQLSRDHR